MRRPLLTMQAGILAWPFLCTAPRDIVAQETLPFPLPPLPHKSSPSLSLLARIPVAHRPPVFAPSRGTLRQQAQRGREGLYSINPKVWNRRRLSRVWNSRSAPLMAARLSLFRIRLYVYLSITSPFSPTMFTNFNCDWDRNGYDQRRSWDLLRRGEDKGCTHL